MEMIHKPVCGNCGQYCLCISSGLPGSVWTEIPCLFHDYFSNLMLHDCLDQDLKDDRICKDGHKALLTKVYNISLWMLG